MQSVALKDDQRDRLQAAPRSARSETPIGAPLPVVSVIIPAFNAAGTLGDALDSLVCQGLKDWEAIVVDDGSRDCTADLARTYSQHTPRVRVLSQPNSGVSSARNAGIAAARAKWLVFLDADDWLAPDHLARLHNALAARPDASVAFCGSWRVKPDKTRLVASWRPDIATRPFEEFARRSAAAIHCFMTHRDLVQSVGGFSPGLSTCEDWDLWQRVARTGARFTGVPEFLAFYRTGEESLSSDVRRMIGDAARVIARAQGSDPRVPQPDPRYANGTDGHGSAEALALFVIWCIAHRAAKGMDGSALLDELSDVPDLQGMSAGILEHLYDGLLVGAGRAPLELASVWPRARGPVQTLLTWLDGASTRAGLGREILSALERRILAGDALEAPTTLTTWAGLRLDITRSLPTVTPAAGIDGIHCRFCAGDQVLGTAELPVFGLLSSATLAEAASQALAPREVIVHGRWHHRPGFWAALGIESIRIAMPLVRKMVARALGRPRALRPLLFRAVRGAIARCLAGRAAATVSHGDARLASLIAEEEAAATVSAAPRPSPASSPGSLSEGRAPDRKHYWENLFEKADPWNYESPYERRKYERTLSLLGDEPAGRGLELACAEGLFTTALAPKVGQLIAADISERALARARERCRQHENIEFRQIDFFDGPIPGGMDLIICSEVLYYLEEKEQLAGIGAKFRDALAPNGRLLTAHAHVLTDDPGCTGFDWGHPFGVTAIIEAFEATDGLVLEKSIQTELYRVDLFRRVDSAGERPPASVSVEPVDSPLEPAVERHLIWGGAVLRRAEALRSETTRVPVLAYHRVAEDGPAALAPYRVRPAAFQEQMRFLRRHGYYAVSSGDLLRHRQAGLPMPGRPVIITFDDGYRDFYETAWPILRRCDFTAEVFVPTDRIGSRAVWDNAHGAPAPLMGWDEIRAAHSEGVRFGSHLASHTAATALSAEALLREGVRSRSVLERGLGCEVRTVALPHGACDERALRILRLCGYTQVFAAAEGVATTDHRAAEAPRITVFGHDTIDAFSKHFE